MADSPLRIHLVDDHDIVRSGLKRLLEDHDDIRVVAESNSGECAIRDYLDHHPDIIVMDLAMPGIGGFEAIHRILAKDQDARILVLSFHEHEAILEHVLQAGASGYLTKGSDPALLIQAVRAIAAGGTFVEPRLAQKLAVPGVVDENKKLQALSPREFEIFLMLAEGNTTRQIADALSISPSTVGNHNYHIMQKLHISSKAELVRLAIQAGLVNV